MLSSQYSPCLLAFLDATEMPRETFLGLDQVLRSNSLEQRIIKIMRQCKWVIVQYKEISGTWGDNLPPIKYQITLHICAIPN